MKNLLDKSAIIKLKLEGLSNRAVSRALSIDKKTVNKYWNQYKVNILKFTSTLYILIFITLFFYIIKFHINGSWTYTIFHLLYTHILSFPHSYLHYPLL